MVFDNFRISMKQLADVRQAWLNLDNWFETTTANDVYEQFLRLAIEGDRENQPLPFDLLTPYEVSNFDAIVSTFHSTSTGEIDLADLFYFLNQACPNQAPLLPSAQPYLTALIYAHARYPFSRPVPLTRAALLRAVMFLTHRGTDFFNQRTILPYHSNTDRLSYIFRVLATPDAGVSQANYDDIVAVLVRLPYPRPSLLTQSIGKRREKFRPMAERLDPLDSGGIDGPLKISREVLRTISKLVASLMGDFAEGNATDSLLPVDKVLYEFLEWASEMRLLRGLDKLFNVMLQPRYSGESEKKGEAIVS
ncbi:Nn.00g031060.m01.CDS01 [Neocucurbitaria sp. VM-36]